MLNLDNYKTTEKIYESINSIVYRAIKKNTNLPVILKVLNKEYPTHEDMIKFHREYDMINMLSDEGIIKLYEKTEIDDLPVIIMEDIGGKSIANILKSRKLKIDEFLNLAIRITEILGHIHSYNIIHKDINPSNIIWNTEKDIIKIIDFGLSTELPREISSVKNPNALEGTLAYISPEQTGRMNRSLDYRTDYYSLGVTFYLMITGQLPFETNDMLELIHCHIALLPSPPHEIDDKIPGAISEIIMKLMAKNEEDRYLSSHGIKSDLEHCFKELQEKGKIKSFKLAQSDKSDKFKIPQKLYGREKEVNELISTFDRLSEDRRELILVSGSPGIGKSLLVNEIHKPIVNHRGYFTSGKFEKLRRDVPYSAFIQAFTNLAKQILAEGEDKMNQWKEEILSAVGSNGKIITDIIPFFEHIIGKQDELPELDPINSQNRFNLVFQNFVRSLSREKHPLVIFLDDLQWADSASLHFLKLFSIDPDSSHLLIIGSYRHNETSDSHPFTLTIEEIKKSGTIVNDLLLKPLKVEHVNQLLNETLNRTRDETKSLAELLILKTRGNPFFLNEFLKFIYHEGLIEFSFDSGWSWDMEGIENAQATDNVLDLMAEKIQDLPEKVQEIIKISSCIGSYFNLEILKDVCGKPEKELNDLLLIALQKGIYDKIDTIYRFNHDRIMDAAYSLITDDNKIKLHHRIGNIVLENTSEETLDQKIFYIVNHLNKCTTLIIDQKEKQNLCKLNFTAAEKALASGAYDSAFNYFKKGINLLGKNSWKEEYNLSLNLYRGATKAAALNGDYTEMEELSKIVIKNAHSIVEMIQIYEAKIYGAVAQNELLKAMKIGIKILRKLGLKFKEKPGMIRNIYEFIRVKLYLRGKSVDDLINLPEIKDPKKLAMLQIFSTGLAAGYYSAPELVPYTVSNMLRLSVKYGNSIYSPVAFALFGVILSGFFGDIDNGYDSGQVAIKLVEKHNFRKIKSRVWMINWFLLNHWKNPMRDSISALIDAYEAGIETGDLESAAISISVSSYYSLLSGVELPELEKILNNAASSIKKYNQTTVLNHHHISQQMVLNLLGVSENPLNLIGHIYDENKMIPVHKEKKDDTALFTVYFYLLMLNYMFEHYEEALKYAEMVKPYAKSQISNPALPVINFYDSLTRLALYLEEKKSTQKKLLKQVIKNQKDMKKFATHAPRNHAHKYNLIEAEIARIMEKKLKAMEHYNLANKLSHKNKFLHEEAVSLESTAKFYLGLKQNDIAELYMTKAFNTFKKWGAEAKLNLMLDRYPSLIQLQSSRKDSSYNTISPTTSSHSVSIDFSSVMKTSQTLSSEIDLNKVLNEIMKFSIENAGAERGVLIIENEKNKKLYVETEGEAQKEITIHEPVPIENHKKLSETIINYVNRTGEIVVLNDASSEGDFTDDSYIAKNNIKSLLCAPITYKGKTSGIIYLENNLSTNTFTTERLELLNVLSSQAAISIENARLLMHRENSAKLEREMEIAAKIQTGLLPENPEIKDFDILAFMEPADEVGGDYYDFIQAGGKDWMVIGDVSGHGIPAGLIMMMVQTSIHTVLAQHEDLSPSEVLNIINKVIKDNISKLQEDKYMTITVFAMHENGHFTFSGLHQDIMVFRAETNEVEIISSDGVWIGLLDNIKEMLNDKNLEMGPGDTMLVYTDGITEAWEKGSIKDKRQPGTQMFGEYRLINILQKNGSENLEKIKTKIIDELDNYDYNDDITMVLVRRLK